MNSHEIACEAINQLAAAVRTLHQFEALFKATRKTLGKDSDEIYLVELGEYAAMDLANGFDCQRESLQSQLNAATQNAKPKNVSRDEGGVLHG